MSRRGRRMARQIEEEDKKREEKEDQHFL